jgi:hypothetical protein
LQKTQAEFADAVPTQAADPKADGDNDGFARDVALCRFDRAADQGQTNELHLTSRRCSSRLPGILGVWGFSLRGVIGPA